MGYPIGVLRVIKFPNHEDKNIIYSFDSLEQLEMEKKQIKNEYDVINITITYPENRKKFESIIVSGEDASSIIERYNYNYYQYKSHENRELGDYTSAQG